MSKKKDNGLMDALADIMGTKTETAYDDPRESQGALYGKLKETISDSEKLQESPSIPKSKKVVTRKDGGIYSMTPRAKVYGSPIPVRLTPEVREKLESYSKAKGLDLGNLLRSIILEYMLRNGIR